MVPFCLKAMKNGASSVTVFGTVAGKPLAVGTIVVADVHFATHEYDGKVYQDVNIFDLMPLKSPQQVGEHF